jgi:hypothetical protein
MIRAFSRCACRALVVVFLLTVQQALSAEPAKDADKSPPVPELVFDPAPEPVPALKHHLLVPVEERIPGNAAPIYDRIVHEHNDAWRTALGKESVRLLDLPFDEFPLAEVRKHLETFEGVFGELSGAARRSHADWQYVTEGQDPVMILLPDAQFMRGYARLLALKVRYDALTGDVDSAVIGLRDGLALGQHVAAAPFLVNQLIGAAVSESMLSQFDIYAAAPKAPNLYWALAALPRPLVSLRRGAATECLILEMKFPELARLDGSRVTPNWQRLSRDLRAWAAHLAKVEEAGNLEVLARIQSPPTDEQLADARAYLRDKHGRPAAEVEAMSTAEVEVRYTVALFRDMGDNWRKWFFIPYPQSIPGSKARNQELAAECRRRELIPLVSLLTPLGANLFLSEARIDRRVARAQTIEALRMHAAASGKLPAGLDEVTVVPVPLDPASGRPFLYTLEGDTATLDVPDPAGIDREHVNLPLRLRLRGK